MLEAIVGALVGAAFTVLGVYWTVHHSDRLAAEARIYDAFDALEEVTLRSLMHLRELEDSGSGAYSLFDLDLWREQRRAGLRVATSAKRTHRSLSRLVAGLTAGYNDQLTVVQWKDPHDYDLERVSAWLQAIRSVIGLGRESLQKLNRFTRAKMITLVEQELAWIKAGEVGGFVDGSSNGFFRLTFDEEMRLASIDPRRRTGRRDV